MNAVADQIKNTLEENGFNVVLAKNDVVIARNDKTEIAIDVDTLKTSVKIANQEIMLYLHEVMNAQKVTLAESIKLVTSILQ